VAAHNPDAPSPARVVAAAAIFRAAKILQVRMDSTLAEFDLSSQRFELLGLLYYSETGRVSLRDLRSATMYHPATLTYTINELEKQGLVRRKADTGDRRLVVAELTARARLVVEAAERNLDQVAWDLADLTEEQAESIAVLLSHLHP
jgi:DNA-binding MarR family transcriptional regulator